MLNDLKTEEAARSTLVSSLSGLSLCTYAPGPGFLTIDGEVLSSLRSPVVPKAAAIGPPKFFFYISLALA